MNVRPVRDAVAMSERIVRALDDLTSVAVRSGAEAPAITRLLESASIATLHAVALAYLYDEPRLEFVAPILKPLAVELPVAA
jgi:hypothetical protein